MVIRKIEGTIQSLYHLVPVRAQTHVCWTSCLLLKWVWSLITCSSASSEGGSESTWSEAWRLQELQVRERGEFEVMWRVERGRRGGVMWRVGGGRRGGVMWRVGGGRRVGVMWRVGGERQVGVMWRVGGGRQVGVMW